jgi:hypothetical protein
MNSKIKVLVLGSTARRSRRGCVACEDELSRHAHCAGVVTIVRLGSFILSRYRCRVGNLIPVAGSSRRTVGCLYNYRPRQSTHKVAKRAVHSITDDRANVPGGSLPLPGGYLSLQRIVFLLRSSAD